MKHIILLLSLLALLPSSGCAESNQAETSEETSFTVEQVTDGLGVPWGLAFISDTQLLITEREGCIKLLDTESKTLTPY